MLVKPIIRVVATGSFDGQLHQGHIQMLANAARLGDELFIFVVPDWIIRQYKNREPIFTQETRIVNVQYLSIATKVLPMTGLTETENLEQVLEVEPDIYAFGGDQLQKNSDWNLALEAKLEERGAKTVIIPRLEGVSTTSLYFNSTEA